MKKLTVLMAMFLCLCMAMPAFADAGVAPLTEDIRADRFIGGSNVLRAQGKEGYGLMNMAGEALTECKYSNFEGKYGYVICAEQNADPVNAFGVLSADGKELIPFAYGDVKLESAEWALGFVLADATADNYDYKSFWGEDKYYLIETVDVYHMPEAAKVGSFARENYMDADAVNHCLNVEDRATGTVTTYDAEFNALGTVSSTYKEDYAPADIQTYRDNGQTGLMDKDGNILAAPAFKYINTIYGNYAEVSTGDKEGLIDLSGNVIVPAEYDDVRYSYYAPYDEATGKAYSFVNGCFVSVLKDGKLVFVDTNGNVTYETGYAKDVLDINGASALLTDLQGGVHILAADGTDTLLEGYERVYPLDYGSGFFYKVTDADYNYGMVDWHGNVILDTVNDRVELSADGNYVLAGHYKTGYTVYELTYPETEAAAAPAEDETAEGDSQTAALVAQVITLLESDAAGNASAAVTLLKTVAGADEAAAAVINSCVTLLESDAAANANGVITLLSTIK